MIKMTLKYPNNNKLKEENIDNMKLKTSKIIISLLKFKLIPYPTTNLSNKI